MKRVGRDISSEDRWREIASSYARGIQGAYHLHRLRVVQTLLPPLAGKRVLDFGCGEGGMIADVLKQGSTTVTGIDINSELLDQASQRGLRAELLLGGVEKLAGLTADSVDCLIALNVLAYLTDEDEREFYRQAQRLVVQDGFMVITHSNALFDMFTLNTYTVDFFRREFGSEIPALLVYPDKPARLSFNIRENPLDYRYKLESYGFREERQEFMNYHPSPPLLTCDDPDDMERPRPDTLNLPEADRWKLMFQCSMFGVRAIRKSM